MSAKSVIAAGLIVFRRIAGNLEYLMLKASYGDFHWSPPKGHVDPGESEFEAALRETTEEAGLSADHLQVIDKFKTVIQYEVRGKPKTVTYWLSELRDVNTEVKVSHEHTDYKWLLLPDAVEYAKYENTKKAISEADEFIRKELLT